MSLSREVPGRRLRLAGGLERPSDPDLPSPRLVGHDPPVGDDGRALVDALEPSLALADRLDREAPEAPGLGPPEPDVQVEPLVGQSDPFDGREIDPRVE